MGKGPFYHTGLATNRDEIRGLVDGNGAGTHYYVDYGSGADANDGLTWGTAFKTYSQAVSAVTTNKNDVIHINGYSQVVETAMVTLSKSRVHTVGHNGVHGHFGHGARISCSASATATNIATFKNTGVRNTFTGIKFENAMTVAQGIYCVAEAGEFARYVNCSFYKSTDLDVTGSSELLLNGDSAMFYDCTVGSLANETEGIHANVLCTNVVNQLRDCYFENCLFLGYGDDTDKVFVYAGAAGSVERMLMFKDCSFINTGINTDDKPAAAVDAAADQTVGLIFLKNCSAVNCTLLAAIDKNIWVDGGPPNEGTTGIAVESVT